MLEEFVVVVVVAAASEVAVVAAAAVEVFVVVVAVAASVVEVAASSAVAVAEPVLDQLVLPWPWVNCPSQVMEFGHSVLLVAAVVVVSEPLQEMLVVVQEVEEQV